MSALVLRELIAEFGNYEVTRHPATGEYEVWSPAARVMITVSRDRAIQWAKSYAGQGVTA